MAKGALSSLMRLLTVSTLLALCPSPVLAEYGRVPFSEVDTSLFRVNEMKVLGTRPDQATRLIDETGRAVTLGSYLGEKPVILVLSYYNCDGTCSAVNADLAAQIGGMAGWSLGQDFRVLTVSFNAEEGADSMTAFRHRLSLPAGSEQGWRFAIAAHADDARRLADSVGFRYFWSPQDRAFLHPGLFIVLTPEGRVARILYGANTESRDVELAVTEALGERIAPAQAFNFALGLCYSYSFAEGRYKLNLPMFFGMASLGIGVVLFLFAAALYRRRRSAFPAGLSIIPRGR